MNDMAISIDAENTESVTDNNSTSMDKLVKDKKDKPHLGKPITKIEISPNGSYLVTYSREDHSIVGWNVEDTDEGRLEPDIEIVNVKIIGHQSVNQIRVSDNRTLAYIYNYIDHDSKNYLGRQKLFDFIFI